MKVILAGYNTDRQFGSDTPETISAAYARISRDPRPVWELRREAAGELASARRSNERIVFGFGHSSVAEHAVFNLDIAGISRYAAEALQSFRLASFMEKSQRYIRIDRGWVVPGELDRTRAAAFDAACRALFDIYSELADMLLQRGLPRESAREDARYALPLCTECQVGLTANARELEHMIRRLSAWPVAEIRDLAAALLEAVGPVAPSLFRYLSPVRMDSFAVGSAMTPRKLPGRPVTMTSWDTDAKIGTFLLAMRDGMTHGEAASEWRGMTPGGREALFSSALDGLGIHDALPRVWEMAHYAFDLSISSTAFAQLKRHRMATILPGSPFVGSGTVVPPSFPASARRLLEKGAALSEDCARSLPEGLRPYILLNAHRRAVSISVNARELVHISRLREDSHAQWDIRGIASKMLALAKRRAPLTLSASGGKSSLER